MDSLHLPCAVLGLTVFLVVCLKLLLFPRPPARRNSEKDVKVVISGPMGGGKTYLWSRLVYPTDRIQTVTSIIENSITLDLTKPADPGQKLDDLPRLPVCLVDTPGHPRLSCRSLARHLPDARALIFVIDPKVGLSGKALRDTAGALELVLGLMQLLHHQDPNGSLPKLSIHLSNPSGGANVTSSAGGGSTWMVEKTRASLTKELNRRKHNPTGTSEGAGFRKTRLESLEAIPSAEFGSIMDVIKRFFSLGPAASLLADAPPGAAQLPEEQSELTKLLEEEQDNLPARLRLLDPLELYENLSGHPVHWSVSGSSPDHGSEIESLKSWLCSL